MQLLEAGKDHPSCFCTPLICSCFYVLRAADHDGISAKISYHTHLVSNDCDLTFILGGGGDRGGATKPVFQVFMCNLTVFICVYGDKTTDILWKSWEPCMWRPNRVFQGKTCCFPNPNQECKHSVVTRLKSKMQPEEMLSSKICGNVHCRYSSPLQQMTVQTKSCIVQLSFLEANFFLTELKNISLQHESSIVLWILVQNIWGFPAAAAAAAVLWLRLGRTGCGCHIIQDQHEALTQHQNNIQEITAGSFTLTQTERGEWWRRRRRGWGGWFNTVAVAPRHHYPHPIPLLWPAPYCQPPEPYSVLVTQQGFMPCATG